MSNVNWEGMHQNGNRPWDLKGVTPMLKYFLEIDETGKNLIENGNIKRILIPGCGQVTKNTRKIFNFCRKMTLNIWEKF